MKRIKKVGKNIIQSDKLVYSFVRAAAASQTASWIDLFTGFALFAWVGLGTALSTAIGALLGGVINCIINFKFTFHAQECSWRAVAVKYTLVWIGSLLLNTYGTAGLYYLLDHWNWLETIGFNRDGYYAAARLSTSLLVSWFWNFILQRYFVYRVTRFDPAAIRLVNFITFRRKKSDNEQ